MRPATPVRSRVALAGARRSPFRTAARAGARAVALLALLAVAGCAHAGRTIPYERVFGSEAPGPYKHPASLAELQNGDLYIAYYGGEGEYATDTKVYGSRRAAAGGPWSSPEVIADTPFTSEGNAVVWQAPDGLVWLFYVVRYGDTWSDSRIAAKVSRDGAVTWSDSYFVALEQGMMVRGRPIVLKNGDYLLPCYHETGHDTENVGADTRSVFLRLAKEDRASGVWKFSGDILSETGNLQPSPAELTDGRIVAYLRRGGDYEPTTDGWIWRSESTDGGHAWRPGARTKFPNPNAAVELLGLSDGALVLFYNDSMNERTPLATAISTDGDRTWRRGPNVAEGEGGDFAYPFAIEGRDGRIHLIFTSDERSVINHAVFRKEDLR